MIAKNRKSFSVRNYRKKPHKGREQACKLTKMLSLLKNSLHSTKKPGFVFFSLRPLLINPLFFMAWS